MANRPQSPEAQVYANIAAEMPCDLENLFDEKTLAVAKAWAKKNHRKWPPRPRSDGWQITIISS